MEVQKKKYANKQEKSKVVKNEGVTDFFYQMRESVLRLTGYTVADIDGVLQAVPFTLSDKVVYSVMFHRYSAFLAENKTGKPLNSIYYDNQSDIALRAGVDRKTVERSIKKLCDIGVVQKFFKDSGTNGARRSASYIVNDLFSSGVNWFYEYNNAEGSSASVTRVFVRKEERQVTDVKPAPKREYAPPHIEKRSEPIRRSWDDEDDQNQPF